MAQKPFCHSEEASEFVPAVLARTVEEAGKYRDLLDDHDIPAILGTDEELDEMTDEDRRLARNRGMTHGVPVLVPESLLDEASEIISDREASGALAGDEDEFDDEDEEEDEEFGLVDREEHDLGVEEEFDEESDVYEDTEDEDEDEES